MLRAGGQWLWEPRTWFQGRGTQKNNRGVEGTQLGKKRDWVQGTAVLEASLLKRQAIKGFWAILSLKAWVF